MGDKGIQRNIGPIPATSPLSDVSLGKSFFKVELLVGDSCTRHAGRCANDKSQGDQVLLPFRQVTPEKDSSLNLDYYCAIPGLAFSIRCSLARPAKKGALYGVRVYVDSGLADQHTVYRKWAKPGSSRRKLSGKDVDKSRSDHYFWFGPGDQEYTIRGFYESALTEKQFVFGEPSRKRHVTGEPLANFLEEANRVGCIRIVFCLVDRLTTDPPDYSAIHIPQQATIDERLDEKIQMAVKPGRSIKTCMYQSNERAILSHDILYERRIIYNTMAGFSTRGITQQCSNQVDFYKGMPLRAFHEDRGRSGGIMAFFRSISSERMRLSKQVRVEAVDTEEAPAVASAVANDFVHVQDLVHYISKSLSPAASFILCTGTSCEENGVLDYGERHVQNQQAIMEERDLHFPEKRRGLIAFFKGNPGAYDLELTSCEDGEQHYLVRLAVVEILDSDSDNDESLG